MTSTEEQPTQTAEQAIRSTIRTTAAQLAEAIYSDLTILDAAPLDKHAARRMQTAAADLAALATTLSHDIEDERARLYRVNRYLSST